MNRSLLFVGALPGTLALALTGCISFGAKPPPSLLNLTASAQVPVGQQASSGQVKSITVLVPAVPQAIAVQRVPVQTTPTTIAYVKDAQWVEPPARLFARLMADTIAARTGRVVLSGAQSASDPGARLTGELRNFGMDAASSAAVVTYDAALIRVGQTDVEKRRFEVRVPVSTIDASSAGTGLNDAANQVATQVADWIGR